MIYQTVLIGIGGAGCKIVHGMQAENKKFYIDTDPKVVEEYSGIRIGTNTCSQYSACGDINLGELSMREDKAKVIESLKEYSDFIIVAPLGGGTSCGATRRLVEYLLDENKKVRILSSMPFDFEGQLRLRKAANTLCYLQELCEVKALKTVDYRAIENIDLGEVFDLQDKVYHEAIVKYCV